MAIGRPRAFDLDKALDQALHVFWRKGYEGASVSDLTAAMGINPPSLYAAFGNKEALFRKALDRYVAERGGLWAEALAQPNAHAVAEALLIRTAEFLGDRSKPEGCLLVQGALTCGDAAQSVRQELCARRAAGLAAIQERLERAKAEGDLPADAEPADLARYLSAVLEGLSVQAASGATGAELGRIAALALRAWPTASHPEPKRTS